MCQPPRFSEENTRPLNTLRKQVLHWQHISRNSGEFFILLQHVLTTKRQKERFCSEHTGSELSWGALSLDSILPPQNAYFLAHFLHLSMSVWLALQGTSKSESCSISGLAVKGIEMQLKCTVAFLLKCKRHVIKECFFCFVKTFFPTLFLTFCCAHKKLETIPCP